MNKSNYQAHSFHKQPKFITYLQSKKSAYPILEEFAKFHQLEPEVTLLDLTDESAGIFFVRVKITDDEIYEASGPSVLEARDRASRIALYNTRLKWPPLSHFKSAENQPASKSDNEADEESKEECQNSEDEPNLKLTREERLAKEAKISADLKKEDDDDTTEESQELQEVRVYAAKVGEIAKWSFSRVPATHRPFPLARPFPFVHGANNSAAFMGKMASSKNYYRQQTGLGSQQKRWPHHRMSYPCSDYGYANPYDFSFGYGSGQSTQNISSTSNQEFLIKAVLTVGRFAYFGIGKDRHSAKEVAVKKALTGLKKIVDNLDNKQTSTENDSTNQNNKKTSISLIYEMAAKRNISVKYDLIETGRPQSRHYVAKFIVGDVESRSENNNKKQAKDIAAEAMLEKLKVIWPLEYQAVMVGSIFKKINKKKKQGDSTDSTQSGHEAQISAKSSSKQTEMDPISALAHYRQTAKKNQPEYKLVESDRQEADQQSVSRKKDFIIECKIDDHVVQGRGNTKKTAKRNSAQAMVDKLNIPLNPPSNTSKSKSSTPGGYPLTTTNIKQPFFKKNRINNPMQMSIQSNSPFHYQHIPHHHYMQHNMDRPNYHSNRSDRNRPNDVHKNESAAGDNRRQISGISNRNSSSSNSNNRQGQLPRGVIYAPEANVTQPQTTTSSTDNSYNQISGSNQMRHMQTTIPNTSGSASVCTSGFHSSSGAASFAHNQHLIHSPDELQQAMDAGFNAATVSANFESYPGVPYGSNSTASAAAQHSTFMQRPVAAAAMNVTPVSSYPNIYPQRDQSQMLASDRVPSLDNVQVYQSQQVSTAHSLSPRTVAMEMITRGYSPNLAAIVDLGEHSLEVRRPKDLLSLLCQVFGFSCQFADFPRGQAGNMDYMTMVTVSTGTNQPVHTVSGVGATIESAYDQAADSMLRNFASNSFSVNNPSSASNIQDPNRARMNMDEGSVHIGYSH